MTGETVQLRACAKLNLALAVGPPLVEGPRAGMHPIASWIIPIDLHDDVEITRRPTGSAAFDARWAAGQPVAWPAENDLALRAHRLLETGFGPLPADLRITKRIPAGGGLGGGSCDAAAVLRGLVRLFELDVSTPELQSMALDLGSDIPFFLDEHDPPRPALVSGLGDEIERLQPLPDPPVFTLVCPPFECPTGEVYRAFDRDRPDAFRRGEVEALARSGSLEGLFNDLATPAGRIRPDLAVLRERLGQDLGAPVHVSGSGSTLFLIGDRADEAESLAPQADVYRAHALS